MAANEDEKWDVEETEDPELEEQDIIGFEINYYPADYTLRGYLDKLAKEQLYVPDFQRSYVWDQVKASKLIESFLLGLPVPGVFLYKEKATNRLQIVDGQQRILSATQFFKNRFGERIFRLKNVHPRWDGKTYEDLDESDQYQLDDTVLRATIIQQLDPEDDSSIYHIFERLNTGGMNLNPMEIRKCVYFGTYFEHLAELNEVPSWREILGRPEPDKRLRDVELVLRVVSLMGAHKKYEKPMKGFLNSFMAKRSKLSETAQEQIIAAEKSVFTQTCDKVFSALGEKPFHLRGRLNYAALDSVMNAVSNHLNRDDDQLAERFKLLEKNDQFEKSTSKSTSDESVLKQRFEVAEELIGAR